MTKVNFPANLFNRASLPKLSPGERQNITVLVVDQDANIRNSLRQLLGGLGFSSVSETSDFVSALQKLEQRKFTHMIFNAGSQNISPKDFLTKVFEYDENIIALPSSNEPSVDDVFDLLVIGAKGYIVKPFNEESIEDALVMATKGEPISGAILNAKNRNEALVSLIMTSLDKLATVMRQAQQFETARREVPKAKMSLRRAMDIGKNFAKGGEDALLQTLIELCLERSHGPASKLGRARKRNKKRKAVNVEPVAEETSKNVAVSGDLNAENKTN